LIIVGSICFPTWIASCFFSLLTIFSSNATRKRMSTISLSTSSPKSSMQKELMTRTTSKTYLSRIVFSSSWISYIKDSRFDLSGKIQTQSMEEQTFSATLKALGKGQCIAISNS
jgi:hypothetical protein